VGMINSEERWHTPASTRGKEEAEEDEEEKK
jgi:hypothetical protein